MAKNDRLDYVNKCVKFAEVQKKQFDIVVKDEQCLGPGTPGYCGMGYGFKKGARFGDASSLDGDEDIRDVCAGVTVDKFTDLPRYLDGVSSKTGLKIPEEFE